MTTRLAIGVSFIVFLFSFTVFFQTEVAAAPGDYCSSGVCLGTNAYTVVSCSPQPDQTCNKQYSSTSTIINCDQYCNGWAAYADCYYSNPDPVCKTNTNSFGIVCSFNASGQCRNQYGTASYCYVLDEPPDCPFQGNTLGCCSSCTPVQGTLSGWSACSPSTCGTTGTQTRTCDGASCGGNCNGAALSQSCSNPPCCDNSCGSVGSYCVGSGYTNGCGNWCSGTLGPNCGAEAGSYCTGTSYSASNGCGNCTGTLGASCTDPATVCSGTPITSANGCGTCASGTKCDAPDTPTPVSPGAGQTFSNVPYVDFSWSAPTSWTGAGTCGSVGTYNLCIGSTSGSCNYVNTNLGTATGYRYYQSGAGTYYWRVQAVNSCGASSAYSSAQTVVLTTPAKLCDIDLSAGEIPVTDSVTVTMAANANSSIGDTARLWVEKADGTIISPNNISPAAIELFYTYYNYNFGGSSCFTTTSSCTTTTNVTLPTKGSYKFHCDLPADPGKCTGNPFCSFNGGPLSCAGWTSCPNGGVIVIDTSDGGGGGGGGGGGTSICSEGFNPTTSVSAWSTFSTCNASHQRTRTRTCTEDCTGIQSCSAYFAANCSVGSSCVTTGGGLSWTQTETDTCYGQMTGTFFDASDLSACPATPQTDLAPKIPGGTISLTGPTSYGPYTTDATGLYTTAATVLSPDTYTLSVNPGGGFVAAPKFNCQGTSLTLSGSASGCLTQPCETAPITMHDFGFWRVYGGWWQTVGGSVYGGTGIQSNIPGPVTAAERYLILQNADSQDGLAQIKSGTIFLGTFPGVTVSVSGWNATSGYSGDNMNYDYFVAKMGSYGKTAWNGSGKPTYNPGGNDYEIYTHTGDVTMNWSPVAGEKVIYFIKGNVTVSGNITITTASPTFQAVIASGTITYNSNVTSVDGWWVGNVLNFASAGVKSDTQFVGNGSFIGWSSITLSRDLTGTLNNTMPAEKFTYRPDLTINAPAPLSQSKYQWRQE